MSTFFDIILSLIVVITYLHVMAANDVNKDDDLDKGAHSERGALWFGPRLGKRSLQFVEEDNSQGILRLLEAADALKYYYNQMPYEMQMQADAPETRVAKKKVILTPKLGRAIEAKERKFENYEYTPRLGRKLSEKIPVTPSEEESYRPDPFTSNPRTNYFSPRLGRTYNFSPRLGRELIYDLYSEPQIRMARSVNNTKQN